MSAVPGFPGGASAKGKTGKKVKLLRCIWLCDPRDCSPPGSFVHRILQARILELVAMPSSGGSSRHRDWTQVSCIGGRFFTAWAAREALKKRIVLVLFICYLSCSIFQARFDIAGPVLLGFSDAELRENVEGEKGWGLRTGSGRRFLVGGSEGKR